MIGGDAIMLDLEDAVAPDVEESAPASLRAGFTDLPVWLVNAVDTPLYDRTNALRR